MRTQYAQASFYTSICCMAEHQVPFFNPLKGRYVNWLLLAIQV